MISISTELQIQIQIQSNAKHNRQTQIHRRLRCSGTNAFINFWVRFFDTRRETILTMLTIPNIRHISWFNLNFSTSLSDPTSQHHCQTPLLNTMVRTQFLNFMVGPQLQLSAAMTDNSTVCLHGSKSKPNWLNGRQHLSIFFHNVHLLPLLLPLIYSGASLIDGSVKGQYVT